MIEKEKPFLLFRKLSNSIYCFFYPNEEGGKPIELLTIDFDFVIFINFETNSIGTLGQEIYLGKSKIELIHKIYKAYKINDSN